MTSCLISGLIICSSSSFKIIFSSQELLGTSCVTPDCHSLIAKIKTVGNDGLVLREVRSLVPLILLT